MRATAEAIRSGRSESVPVEFSHNQRHRRCIQYVQFPFGPVACLQAKLEHVATPEDFNEWTQLRKFYEGYSKTT